MKDFYDLREENIPECNTTDFLQYSHLKTYLMLNSTFKISKATKCLPNCEVYKYDIVKTEIWPVKSKIDSPSNQITLEDYNYI